MIELKVNGGEVEGHIEGDFTTLLAEAGIAFGDVLREIFSAMPRMPVGLKIPY